MANLTQYPAENISGGNHLQVMAWNRFSNSSISLQPYIKRMVQDPFILNSLGSGAKHNLVATEQFLIAGLNKFSSPMRGQLISSVKKNRIDIFGGDLSYGKINDPLLKIQQDNIYYQQKKVDTSTFNDTSKAYGFDRIPSHSFIFGAWVEHGILAMLFFVSMSDLEHVSFSEALMLNIFSISVSLSLTSTTAESNFCISFKSRTKLNALVP
jgi:hypothetical protein